MQTPLKSAREACGVTTYDVARAIGIAQSHYSRVENGSGASPELAEKLSKYFGGKVTEEQILYSKRYVTEQSGEAA